MDELGQEQSKKSLGKGCLITILLVIGIAVCGYAAGNLGDDSSPTRTTSGTPRNATEAAEKCLSAWDGNHDGFERQVKELLNDPGSMETHGTYFNSSEDISDGSMLLRMDYGARNQLGGMVRTNAFGEMNIRTCRVTVTDYGFG